MRRTILTALLLPLLLTACDGAPVALQAPPPIDEALHAPAVTPGMIRMTFPDPDPGVPAYARFGLPTNQLLHDGEWLAIPMLRDPACIPADFNLLNFFDPPGEGGPGAFACPLKLHGWYMIEADAPLGTFPSIVHSSGDAVPFWFVRWSEFQPLLAGGEVNIGDLAALPSLVRGTADRFAETLHPRLENHRVVVDAQGHLEDGGRFRFHLTHIGDRIVTIRIRFR
ncbi:hypothetical protein BH23GEM6_BH23GEM6_24710 [soil metagenome]